MLLSASRQELGDVVRRVVIESSTSSLISSNSASLNPALSNAISSNPAATPSSTPSLNRIKSGTGTRWKCPPSRIAKVGGRVLVCAIEDIPADLGMDMALAKTRTSISEQEEEPVDDQKMIFIVISSAPAPISTADFSSSVSLESRPTPELESNTISLLSTPATYPPPPTTSHHSQMTRVLQLYLEYGKKGQHTFLHDTLPRSLSFIHYHLSQNQSRSICIACETGKDASVGVALTVLQVWFDDQGRLRDKTAKEELKATKQSIRTRLEWIIESRPMANPSRTTLKRVNEYLLSPFARRM